MMTSCLAEYALSQGYSWTCNGNTQTIVCCVGIFTSSVFIVSCVCMFTSSVFTLLTHHMAGVTPKARAKCVNTAHIVSLRHIIHYYIPRFVLYDD